MSIAVIHGIRNGCTVTADGSTLNLAITQGTYINQNVIAAPNVSSFAAQSGDPNFDRYDLIAGDTAGNVYSVTGVADGTMLQPDSNDVILAYYAVRAGATAVQPGDVQQRAATVYAEHPAQSFAMTFLSSAHTPGTDPGLGNCQFDTTNINTIAHLYVNYSTATAPSSFKSWLQKNNAVVSPSQPGYYLRLWSRRDPSSWVLIEVTAFTDHSTYCDLTCVVAVESSGAAAPNLSTDALDTIFEFAGIVPPSPATTANGSGALTGDVTISSTAWTDGVSTGTLAAGTWLITGQVTLQGAVGGPLVTVRLWDGSTVFAETENSVGTSAQVSAAPLSVIVAPSVPASFRLSARSTSGSPKMKAACVDNSGGNVATLFNWVKLS